MGRIRLDKYLADTGAGSRSEVREFIKKGRVMVNALPIRNSGEKIEPGADTVLLDFKEIGYERFRYYMLHKPAGYVSATEDSRERTVLELVPDSRGRELLFPVGRLDKDTEGLLLITDDGDLAHRLLSPKRHVAKVYYARIGGDLEEEAVELFEKGITMSGGVTALPAKLEILKSAGQSEILLTLYEGKFHQVKRMFEAIGKKVIYLKRLSMGGLELDEALAPGECRRLTEQEIALLQNQTEEDADKCREEQNAKK